MLAINTASAFSSRALPFSYYYSLPFLVIPTKTDINSPSSQRNLFMGSASRSPPREAHIEDTGDGFISLQEWQGWGAVSPVPALVQEIVQDLKVLEKSTDAQMNFGGIGGKLQGDFRIQEDKKHRAKYQALGDSEKKLQFFSARQIACRLLGSRGYLCQKCWLAMQDCMCLKVKHCDLWHGVRFWLYMHPKDFLRQNNTGKVLWQVFGVRSATLCLFGIAEDEEIMWDAFNRAGKSNVWCLYPNKNAVTESIPEALGQRSSGDVEFHSCDGCNSDDGSTTHTNGDKTLNFVLIDGTWNNSGAMFNRLKEKAKSVWGEEKFPCISLNMGASAMHKLRPQPSWDRTCTAAAAIGLLSELQQLEQFSLYGLVKQADAVEEALVVLLDALTARRLRMGRSITRKVRVTGNIC